MSTPDRFGLRREHMILASGVRSIFTPHQPITSEDLLFGRQREVQLLIEHVNTPGQHALLYGERGVGKSSLANVTAEIFLRILVDGEVYVKRCDSSDTFETIVRKPLEAVDVHLDLRQVTESVDRSRAGSIGLRGTNVSGGRSAGTTVSE